MEKKDEFLELIKYDLMQGMACMHIRKKYSIKKTTLEKMLSPEFLDLLNNNGRKSRGDHRRRLTVEGYAKYDEEYGKQIEKAIDEGVSLSALSRKFGRATIFFSRFLSWKDDGLLKKIYQYSKSEEFIVEQARRNGRKSRDTLKGKELKPLTDEIKRWYQNALSEEMCRADVVLELKTRGYGFKKFQQLKKLFGKPKLCGTWGERNPMFGKTPSEKAGIGTKGWLTTKGQKIYFRSSLEMKIFLYLLEHDSEFQISKHRIPYIYEGRPRTYCPDYVSLLTVCEIKPLALVSIGENIPKFESARSYCVERGLKYEVITENSYDLSRYNKETINELIEEGKILITKDNYEKLMRNLKE